MSMAGFLLVSACNTETVMLPMASSTLPDTVVMK